MLLNRFKRRLLNYLLSKHFVVITEGDLLRTTPDGVKFGRRTITPEELTRLSADAKSFKNTLLWETLKTELLYDGCRRIYFEGHTDDDRLAGKIQIHIIKTLEERLNNL